MHENMTQEQRLDYLVEEFKMDSGDYQNIETPSDVEGKRRILRSLMNIRMPRPMSDSTIKVQDAYLLQRAEDKGIVHVSDIPTVQETFGGAQPYADRICIWQGDITRLAADAIVNAANSQMLGCFVAMHSCIDNCIHSFAGIEMRAECHRQMTELRMKYGRDYEQPTAIPMLTDGYNLPAKKVIHIVGPIVQGRLTPELEKDLADCYRNSLELCREHGLNSIAFCCISTGVFHFPNDRAAAIAVSTVQAWLRDHDGAMDKVIFNVFKDEDKILYENLLSGRE